MRQKILCLAFILLGLYQSATAQQDRFSWRLGVYGGFTNYYGELENRLFPPNPLLSKERNTDFLTYGVSLENTFSRAWSWKATYTNGMFRANDIRRNWKNEIEADSPNFGRGLNAQTEIQDFGLLMTYYTDNGKLFGRKSFISPYFSFGAGISSFQVFGDLQDAQGQTYYYWTDQTIRNQPEGTAGAVEIAQDGVFETNLSEENPNSYNTTTFNLQAGLGLKLRLGSRFNFNMEMMVKQTFTDNLDNFADPNNTWNDAYAYGSVSLHYNFAKKTQTFRSPKIYASPYPKEMSIAKKDSLGRVKDTLSALQPQMIERQEIVLKEDSIVLYQNNKPLERIATSQIYQYDTSEYTYTPSIAKYQTEGSTVVTRDTTYINLADSLPKQYIIKEIIYRPQTQDTLQVRRYIRDTIRTTRLQNTDYQPVTRLEGFTEEGIYKYNPYQGAPSVYNTYESPLENNQKEKTNRINRKPNYRYENPNTPTNNRNNVVVPLADFRQNTNQDTTADSSDSTALSTEQRLKSVEEKLDLVAWQILKAQKQKADSLGNIQTEPALNPTIQKDSTNIKKTQTDPDSPQVSPKEVMELKVKIQNLENKITALQQSENASKPSAKVLGELKISFASGFYTLTADDKAKIKALVAERNTSNYHYELKGFADSVGDAQQNLILSKMRADAVRNELLSLGIRMEQISSDFYGASISSSTERKVEIKLIEK